MYKDKLIDKVRERRFKDKTCYKCDISDYRTAKCIVKK